MEQRPRNGEMLADFEKKSGIKLSETRKILAVTDGSITQIIEILKGAPVRLKTIQQRVSQAGKEAEKLGVSPEDEVNFREVLIIANGETLVHALSMMPLARLKTQFKDDLMKADVPIGKLLSKHRIEARRELLSIREGKSPYIEGRCLEREYDIINGGKVMMHITEFIKL